MFQNSVLEQWGAQFVCCWSQRGVNMKTFYNYLLKGESPKVQYFLNFMFIKRFVFLILSCFRNQGLPRSATNCREEQFIFELFYKRFFYRKLNNSGKYTVPLVERIYWKTATFFSLSSYVAQVPLPSQLYIRYGQDPTL